MACLSSKTLLATAQLLEIQKKYKSKYWICQKVFRHNYVNKNKLKRYDQNFYHCELLGFFPID